MTAARFTSGVDGGESSDLYLSSATRAAWHSLGNRLWAVFPVVQPAVSRAAACNSFPRRGGAPRVELICSSMSAT